MQRVFEKLRQGVNQQAWGMGPLTVNAYYAPEINKFVMPIGILQFPFFAADGDVIENLGAVGAVVGHELGHSIDDQGSKYDSSGRLKQWMTEADLKNFSSRSSIYLYYCFRFNRNVFAYIQHSNYFYVDLRYLGLFPKKNKR